MKEYNQSRILIGRKGPIDFIACTIYEFLSKILSVYQFLVSSHFIWNQLLIILFFEVKPSIFSTTSMATWFNIGYQKSFYWKTVSSTYMRKKFYII